MERREFSMVIASPVYKAHAFSCPVRRAVQPGGSGVAVPEYNAVMNTEAAR